MPRSKNAWEFDESLLAVQKELAVKIIEGQDHEDLLHALDVLKTRVLSEDMARMFTSDVFVAIAESKSMVLEDSAVVQFWRSVTVREKVKIVGLPREVWEWIEWFLTIESDGRPVELDTGALRYEHCPEFIDMILSGVMTTAGPDHIWSVHFSEHVGAPLDCLWISRNMELLLTKASSLSSGVCRIRAVPAPILELVLRRNSRVTRGPVAV